MPGWVSLGSACAPGAGVAAVSPLVVAGGDGGVVACLGVGVGADDAVVLGEVAGARAAQPVSTEDIAMIRNAVFK